MLELSLVKEGLDVTLFFGSECVWRLFSVPGWYSTLRCAGFSREITTLSAGQ